MLNNVQAKALVEKITAATKFYAVAVISGSEQGTTRFANSEISQNVTIADTRLSLTLYDGKKQSTCATNDLSDGGIAQVVKEAETMLAFVPEGEFGTFPFSQTAVPNRAKSDALAKAFDVAGRAAAIKAGVALLEPGYTASGALTLTDTVFAVGESGGGFRYASYYDVAFNTVVSHESGADGAGECVSYTIAPDIVGCFKKAQATAKAALNPVEPPLGAVTVVLSPVAFGDLVSFAANMMNAKSVEDGVSFARGKLGERVFGENLTIRDDVTNPELLPLFFDVEGNPKQVLPLIENGVVSGYAYDNKRAAKAGVDSTGHAVVARWYSGAIPMNIVVEGGDKSLEEMIAGTEKGVFVNEFHYTNFVNARNLQVTGLTRNGTFLIENGKLTKPISTVRFTESLLDAFNHITEVSKERELVSGFGAMLVPGVKIEDFHFTSKA
ncbi:MAG: TldD/PmbA family protein [Defluviitaleaceae bacterium]|nr:TldD/PmbA family protein [Defluviitaleaceae bacterium]